MIRETDLSQVLAAIGYVRREPWIFQLKKNGGEVEHFLYFLLRQEKNLIAARFGFRVPDVESFSIETFSRYARDDFPTQKMLAPYSCSMRYSFGRFHSMLRPGYWSLANDNDWVLPIRTDIVAYLMPFACGISDSEKVFELLASDEEPCPWFANNAAIRLAQVLFLGIRLGRPRAGLEELATARLHEVQRDLAAENDANSAEKFIRDIFAAMAIN